MDWREIITIYPMYGSETADQDIEILSQALDRLSEIPQVQQAFLEIRKKLDGWGKSTLSIYPDHSSMLEILNQEALDTGIMRHGEVAENLTFSFSQMESTMYRGKDGEYHRYSPEHVLAHELIGHVASGVTKDDEQLATDIVNPILEALGEVPRGDYYDSCLTQEAVEKYSIKLAEGEFSCEAEMPQQLLPSQERDLSRNR